MPSAKATSTLLSMCLRRERIQKFTKFQKLKCITLFLNYWEYSIFQFHGPQANRPFGNRRINEHWSIRCSEPYSWLHGGHFFPIESKVSAISSFSELFWVCSWETLINSTLPRLIFSDSIELFLFGPTDSPFMLLSSFFRCSPSGTGSRTYASTVCSWLEFLTFFQ